jgi:hypothetical protein
MRMRLADTAIGIHARLANAQPALLELRLQHGDLLSRVPQFGFGLFDIRLGLLDAGFDLVVIEHSDDLSGFDRVAFTDGDSADTA